MNNEVYVESTPEEELEYSEDIPYDTNSWGADLSFRDLLTRLKEKELIKPELQRNFVWDKKEASRFIDSLLLGLPIPSIFLAKKEDNFFIVDGFQRITTVNDFVNGIFSRDKSIFKLTNSDTINERWRGKSFKELSHSEQKRILSTTIHAIIFSYKIDPSKKNTILYQVFKRINESGKTLTPQEIRNCIYQGKFNDLLKLLNKDDNWRDLYGRPPDSRMKDLELILRFFTISGDMVLKSKSSQISLSKELNLFMENNEFIIEKKLFQYEKEFRKVIKFIKENMSLNAFHNYSKDKAGKIKKEYTLSDKFHPTIFDAISIATLFALRKNNIKDLKNLEVKRLNLLKNKDFIEATSIRTTNTENIKMRISLALKFIYGIEYEK